MCVRRDCFDPDLAAALWVAENLRPLAVVEDSGLKRYIDSILEHVRLPSAPEFSYTPPSRQAVTSRLGALKNDTKR